MTKNNGQINNEKVDLESKRKEFKNKYKKFQTIQLIVIGIFILAMFLALFLLTSKPQYIVYTFIGIVVLFLTAYLYTRFSRKRKFEIVKEYVSEYRKKERELAYSIKNLIIEEFDEFGKVNVENVKVLFNNTNNIESNNVVKGKLNDNKFSSTSVVAYKDKTKVAFSGKYFEFEINKNIQGKIVIEICKDNKLDVNLQGLNKVLLPGLDKADIYSDLDKDSVSKFFTKKTSKEINDITLDENIDNVCILIKYNKAIVLMSADNRLIDVMVEKQIDESLFITLQKHIKEVVSLIETL